MGYDPMVTGQVVVWAMTPWLGSCLGYDSTVPSKFLVGTNCGKALICSRKIKSQVNTIFFYLQTKSMS